MKVNARGVIRIVESIIDAAVPDKARLKALAALAAHMADRINQVRQRAEKRDAPDNVLEILALARDSALTLAKILRGAAAAFR